jgi:hypothetical protein
VISEIVVGATNCELEVTLENENGIAIDLGATGQAWLQGHSGELPNDDINVEGDVTNPSAGIVTWPLLGGSTYVSEADLVGADIGSATYRCRVKYKTSAGLYGWTNETDLTWLLPPILTPVAP